MALEAAFQHLCTQLLALHEAFVSVRTTAREDKPLQDDAVLVDVFGDASDDLLGLIEEALSAARDWQPTASSVSSFQHVGDALTLCQDRLNQVNHRCSADLLCYERIRELRRFGRRRGGEWRGWARSLKAALESCRQPLFDADNALLRCWRDVVEYGGKPSVSVQTTSITQQLALPAQHDLATAMT